MVNPLDLRQLLVKGMDWFEVRAWVWETPGLYTRRAGDTLEVVQEKGGKVLARLDLNGYPIYLASEKEFEEVRERAVEEG